MPTKPASGLSLSRAQRGVLLALLPGAAVSLWFNGWAPLLQWLLITSSCLACQLLIARSAVNEQHRGLHVGGALITALLLSLALPAYTPWWLSICSAAFATLLGKSLFGSVGRNPFNPAMLGYAFAVLCAPAAMSQWPNTALSPDALGTAQLIFGAADGLDAWSSATALEALRNNDRLTFAELSGTHPAFAILGGREALWLNLAFLLGGLWLLKQRIISWHTPAGLLGGLFMASLLCWNGSGSDGNGSPLFHLFSGASMLAAFFIASEPASGAHSARGKLLFGVGAGLLIYVIRTWGSYPDGVAFAILLMNLCVTRLDAPRVTR